MAGGNPEKSGTVRRTAGFTPFPAPLDAPLPTPFGPLCGRWRVAGARGGIGANKGCCGGGGSSGGSGSCASAARSGFGSNGVGCGGRHAVLLDHRRRQRRRQLVEPVERRMRAVPCMRVRRRKVRRCRRLREMLRRQAELVHRRRWRRPFERLRQVEGRRRRGHAARPRTAVAAWRKLVLRRRELVLLGRHGRILLGVRRRSTVVLRHRGHAAEVGLRHLVVMHMRRRRGVRPAAPAGGGARRKRGRTVLFGSVLGGTGGRPFGLLRRSVAASRRWSSPQRRVTGLLGALLALRLGAEQAARAQLVLGGAHHLQELQHVAVRHRLAVVEPLRILAVDRAQEADVLRRLDALGDDVLAELVRRAPRSSARWPIRRRRFRRSPAPARGRS